MADRDLNDDATVSAPGSTLPTESDRDTMPVFLDSDLTVSEPTCSESDFASIRSRFQEELSTGRGPSIEDFTLENPLLQQRLLPELIALEMDYRWEQNPGVAPDPGEYHNRFPDQKAAVELAFQIFGDLVLARSSPQSKSQSDRWFGQFELLEELGRGGQGVVYRARRPGLHGVEHVVALKLILPSRIASSRHVDRFVREVRAMSRLNHRGILTVYDSGEDRGQPYVAMKLVGLSLEHAIKVQGPYPPDEAARLVAEIAYAVEYLHRNGIVHHDLKPSNILLDGDQPQITDFGLSRVLDPAQGSDLYSRGEVEGTIAYMPPEQLHGDAEKPTDIYALGVILFELLTGRPPFGTGLQAVEKILRDEAPALSDFVPRIPSALDRIVRKCMQKDPAARYTTAAQLAEELERFRRHEPLTYTPTDTALQNLVVRARRHPEMTSRLVALFGVFALTQLNYFVLLTNPKFWLHVRVCAVELVWILSVVVFDRLSLKEDGREAIRPAWIVADVILLTVLLWQFTTNAVATAMVMGYQLLIAFSGIWMRVRLVWLTTACCIAGYAALAFQAHQRGLSWASGRTEHDPNLVLVLMIVMGYVIAFQVERARALETCIRPRG